MIFTNVPLSIKTRTFTDRKTGKLFSINQVLVGTPSQDGENLQYEEAIILTVPKTVMKIETGLNPNLNIGYTESFRPRIHEGKSDDVYLLLTARGETAVGCDTIQVPFNSKNSVHVLKRGYGYEGATLNKAHTWRTALLRFFSNTGLVRIHTVDDKEDTILVVAGGKVVKCSERTLPTVAKFHSIRLPAHHIKWVDI